MFKKIFALVTIFSALISSVFCPTHVQAYYSGEYTPGFGLYCSDFNVIESGTVRFDLTDYEAVTGGTGIVQSEYRIAASNRETEFQIPFLSSAENMPPIVAKANGQEIKGTIWYGDKVFAIGNNFDIEAKMKNIYSPVLEENIFGTLYTVIPDSDTITIELSFEKDNYKSFIYETSKSGTSSVSVSGKNSWTLKNALSKNYYRFFVTGKQSDHLFSSSCKYRIERLTCKDFVDSQYTLYEEYYSEYKISVDFLYSMLNGVIQNNSSMEFDEIFFDSIRANRFNSYKFYLPLETNTVIDYEMPIGVQCDFHFDPTVYSVEQKRSGNYKIRYSIELNEKIPYIVESNVKINKSMDGYTAETAENFYYVFSSSEKPASNLLQRNDKKRRIIIVSVIGGISFIFGTVCIIRILRDKRKDG